MADKTNAEQRKENAQKRKEAEKKRLEKLRVDQKAQAIKLMKLLKMEENTIKHFEEENELCVSGLTPFIDKDTGIKNYILTYREPDEELKKKIKALEEEFKFLCFYVMENSTQFGELISLLIVCKQREEWKMDEENAIYEIDDKKTIEMLSYVINEDDPDLSEFGYIGIRKINENYVRVY